MTTHENLGAILGPIHHLGYVVDDLEAAIHHWVDVLGAGPFFVFEHSPIDEIEFDGPGPLVIDQSAAFGRFGSIFVELQLLHDVRPPALHDLFAVHGGLNHVAYAVPDGDAARGWLSARGYPAALTVRQFGLAPTWHDLRSTLGHCIEVHDDSDAMRATAEFVTAASEGFDGRDPIRTMDLG